jgi:predicted CoA-binding protein
MKMPEPRTWIGPEALARQRILREMRTVAIVGASANPSRASYFVWTYLKSTSDYAVYLVNPTITEVEGTPVYPSLAELPVVPDLVDVFRRHDEIPSVLDDTIAVGAKTIWLQLGLWHEQVARDGGASGLHVVMDRCLKIEHARFHGGLHLAGFNTGVIDSRRPK